MLIFSIKWQIPFWSNLDQKVLLQMANNCLLFYWFIISVLFLCWSSNKFIFVIDVGLWARHNMQVLLYHLHCAKQAHATTSNIFLTELNTNKSLTAEVWSTKHCTRLYSKYLIGVALFYATVPMKVCILEGILPPPHFPARR